MTSLKLIVALVTFKFSLTEDGRFQCDDDACPNFHQRFICSHRVAAAESNVSLRIMVDLPRLAKVNKASQDNQ